MASLTKVRALPDMRVLPAHGPVAPYLHALEKLFGLEDKPEAPTSDSEDE